MNLIFVLGVVITLATGAPVLIQLLRNHPRGLIVLFFAEMWERFSYYGMRGILIFYLTQHLLFDDGTANLQYGSYTSLVYLLPLLGGLLADRWLGTRKAVAFGALLLVAGHLTMAVEGAPSRWHRVDADEVWAWHAGAPLELAIAGEAGAIEPLRMGMDAGLGEVPQAVVPTGAWQFARALGAWALVSCIVFPGFTYEGFEMAPEGWRPGDPS